MAKIKKVIENGSIQYPATITDAVKNPNNGKTVTQELSELGSEIKNIVGFSEQLNQIGSYSEAFYYNAEKGDKIKVELLGGESSSIRYALLFVNDSWITLDYPIVNLGEKFMFEYPYQCERIRFYLWGQGATINIKKVGHKSLIEENKSLIEENKSLIEENKSLIEENKGYDVVIEGNSGETKDFTGLSIVKGTRVRIINNGKGTIGSIQLFDNELNDWINIRTNDVADRTISNEYVDFTSTINTDRIRIYFSTSSVVRIINHNSISFNSYLTAQHEFSLEHPNGITSYIYGTDNLTAEIGNCYITTGGEYFLQNIGDGQISNIQLYDYETKEWITIKSDKLYSGDTSSFVSPITTKRIRAYFSETSRLKIYNKSLLTKILSECNDLKIYAGWGNSESPISADMLCNKTNFCNTMNTLWDSYANFCLSAVACFEPLKASRSWTEICEVINHNFRKDVVTWGMSFERMAWNINQAFSERIYRFCDAKLNMGANRDFSLDTGFQADEPSAVVSEDGNTLHIYAHLKRISTTDGINWTEPIETPLIGGSSYIRHNGINYIDGVYYMIGCENNLGGDLLLYTSKDGISFEYKGVLFKENHSFHQDSTVNNWGNSYLIREKGSNKFYLYIEYEDDDNVWIISCVKCNDILHNNDDGTIGDWINSDYNPIIYLNQNSGWKTAGNVDFAKLSDNRPIKSNGKYYIYFHTTYQSQSNIQRAYSYDLENWFVEGFIFDNRDKPSAGDNTSGNADHCIIEFKGRTYLFYTWNINTTLYEPRIKYTIDDRPLNELLKLRP